MCYTMVLNVRFYRGDDGVYGESAFLIHLRNLERHILAYSDELLIVSPETTEESYQENSGSYEKVELEQLRFKHKSVFSKGFISGIAGVIAAVKKSKVLQFGSTYNFRKPQCLVALLTNIFYRRPSIFIKDIDHRSSSKMLWERREISRINYLKQVLIYDRLASLQVRLACRFCTLTLIKSVSAVEYYGKRKENVKNFYDVAHDIEMLPNDDELKRAIDTQLSRLTTKLVYFGRIVEYKGIKDMIEVVDQANQRSKRVKFELSIIGDGSQSEELRSFVAHKRLENVVHFLPAQKYGKEFIAQLMNYDALLACPKRQDTPRSVFDAMAAGLPTFAYDTYYYTSLEETGVVFTSDFASPQAMVDALLEYKSDSTAYRRIRESAFSYAKQNTQRGWIQKRYDWFDQFYSE